MELNDLLGILDIDPEEVLVFRHRPHEPPLNKVLPWLAAEKPEVFNAYQQTQGKKLETVMQRMVGRGYVASFIGNEAGKALFIGLYSIDRARPMTREEFWAVPAYIEMKALGMEGLSEESGRTSVVWFDLRLRDFYSDWKGKLIVNWPPPERSWWRRAHRNRIPVFAILEESALDSGPPSWHEIVLHWEELSVLPKSWRSALSQWRGIYFVYDASDGKGYVGSAYGKENLLGRWQSYAARGHGGNRLLRRRNPKNFRFSILQRVSPDMESRELVAVEESWKKRLHTHHPEGLNDN
jgi:hypothetical protein